MLKKLTNSNGCAKKEIVERQAMLVRCNYACYFECDASGMLEQSALASMLYY